jgi:catechol 2,3-dioxygenase-like lactoylglutathione lyase family enzyme
MSQLSSIAIRVSNLDAMVRFYSEAFHIQFQEVNTSGIPSQFGELNGITLKLVPIRDEADFQSFPIHQPGFVVPDVEAVIALAIQYGGRQEGSLLRNQDGVQAAIRDPDGNTIELYSK